MPYDLWRMKWCRQWGWTPEQFDNTDASDLEVWQDLMAEEDEWTRYQAKVEQSRQERHR